MDSDWWNKPEYIINEVNINSVIGRPCHGEVLPINSATTLGPYTLKGYAYSGGGKKVTRVEVTMDGGETWLLCALDNLEKPNEYGKYWCWCFWSLKVKVVDLLGSKEMAVRAWDETLNTQPQKLIWNVMGMMNNCWFRVKMKVCEREKGEIALVFEDPVQPGELSGGWMNPQNSSSETQHPKEKIDYRKFSMDDVMKHNSKESAWIVVRNHVYDCTSYLNLHPGGKERILDNAGSECTQAFEQSHSAYAKKKLEEFRIGELIPTSYPPDSSTPVPSVEEAMVENSALIPGKEIECNLMSKNIIAPNVYLFKFKLPSPNHVLGVPVGKHIKLIANIGEEMCIRSYTPTSSDDQLGYFELVMKIYPKGTMTQYLKSLAINRPIIVEGPFGLIKYTGRGKFTANGEPKFAKRLVMLAGGTGITPMYQVIQASLKDGEDDMEMYFVYENRTEDDIILRKKLDEWAKKNERLKVWYVVGETTTTTREEWKYSVGRITEEILRKHVPEGSSDTLALVCGTRNMIESAVKNLEKINYDVKSQVLLF